MDVRTREAFKISNIHSWCQFIFPLENDIWQSIRAREKFLAYMLVDENWFACSQTERLLKEFDSATKEEAGNHK